MINQKTVTIVLISGIFWTLGIFIHEYFHVGLMAVIGLIMPNWKIEGGKK